MQLTLGELTQFSPTSVESVWRRPLTATLAYSLFCAGVMVETLGIALIAAFGWLIVGGAIAVCGLATGMFASRRWPEPAASVSTATLVRDYASMRRPARRRSTH